MENKIPFKYIRKSVDFCTEETLKSLINQYPLIISDFKKPNSDNMPFKAYLKSFEKISKQKRKIIFYGYPIQLSKQQYMLISILLYEQIIIEADFYQIIKNNLKKTISDLKRKIKKEITNKQNKDEQFVFNFEEKFKTLISYKKDDSFNQYTIITNFVQKTMN